MFLMNQSIVKEPSVLNGIMLKTVLVKKLVAIYDFRYGFQGASCS